MQFLKFCRLYRGMIAVSSLDSFDWRVDYIMSSSELQVGFCIPYSPPHLHNTRPILENSLFSCDRWILLKLHIFRINK